MEYNTKTKSFSSTKLLLAIKRLDKEKRRRREEKKKKKKKEATVTHSIFPQRVRIFKECCSIFSPTITDDVSLDSRQSQFKSSTLGFRRCYW